MPTIMVPTVVALGSNMGDRLALMQSAIDSMGRKFQLEAVSHVYETEPMYLADQAPFLNAAVLVGVDVYPRALLSLLKAIEEEVGRGDGPRFGPREIDLDVIVYGSLRYRFEGGDRALTVPHSKLAERRFALLPTLDVAPDIEVPGLGSIRALVQATESTAGTVKMLSDAALSLPRDR